MPIIPAIQEAEAGVSQVWGYLDKVSEPLSQKQKLSSSGTTLT
jgi:hypothetical protein